MRVAVVQIRGFMPLVKVVPDRIEVGPMHTSATPALQRHRIAPAEDREQVNGLPNTSLAAS